jgi:FixJ family two-component response regulator
MTTDGHIVFIVDDDPRIREALVELLASHGMRAAAFASAGAYIAAEKPDLPACLILDGPRPSRPSSSTACATASWCSATVS